MEDQVGEAIQRAALAGIVTKQPGRRKTEDGLQICGRKRYFAHLALLTES
jgi:hypothetical protein